MFWPVPIDPVPWQPPPSPGLTGPYAANQALADAELLASGFGVGPETIALGPDGRLYTGLRDGRIVRLRPDGSDVQTFADTGGSPGGMEFDSNTVRESRRQAALEQSTLYNVSDVSTIVIEVRLQSYQPAGSPTRQFDAEKTVAWRGLRADKRRFPQITKIQNLASAWAELISLAERVEAGGGS